MLFTKNEHMITRVAALSSPVSTFYARNAWDHDPFWRLRTACILRLELSYRSPSKKVRDRVTVALNTVAHNCHGKTKSHDTTNLP